MEQQLSESEEKGANLQQQASEAAALAEQRARDKAQSDREWGRKLGARVKDLETKLQDSEERGAS